MLVRVWVRIVFKILGNPGSVYDRITLCPTRVWNCRSYRCAFPLRWKEIIGLNFRHGSIRSAIIIRDGSRTRLNPLPVGWRSSKNHVVLIDYRPVGVETITGEFS